MDLRQLRCFVAVAEDLHFHKAARRLGIAQPALSRTIKKLEDDLGATLLVRTNRKVELTDAGYILLKGATRVLGQMNRLVDDVRSGHKGKRSVLRIGYTDNAINGVAPRLLKAFQSAHPDIELQLQHLVTANQFRSLEDGVIDLGFATGQQGRSGFESLCIQRERFICLVYDDHPLAGKQGIKLRDLAEEPMVRGEPTDWAHFHSALKPSFLRAGFEPIVAQEGLTTASIQRLVSCGMGVAILTETVAETLVPNVQVLALEDVSDSLSTMVIWKTGEISSATDNFVRFLNGEFCR